MSTSHVEIMIELYTEKIYSHIAILKKFIQNLDPLNSNCIKYFLIDLRNNNS